MVSDVICTAKTPGEFLATLHRALAILTQLIGTSRSERLSDHVASSYVPPSGVTTILR